MNLDIKAARQVILDHAAQSGLYDGVLGHEPISAPRTGLTIGVWAHHIKPIAKASGLNVTSARVLMFARIYTSTIQAPADDIDLLVGNACADLIGRLTGDYNLGGTVSNIDLLAAHGIAMESELGYLPQPNGEKSRIASIVIPLVFNDVWTQEA
ncbi:hypothetical protein [Herbidospora daliensis]|uniref:hypothetical protein n=1 Tax=Herbidospora daliensis TaxID=295585 RepID=UPI0007805011|nr:hypothetical protein [Herbidospora daliensis]